MKEILNQILDELKKLNGKPKAYVTIAEFAVLSGLPEHLVRKMAKQGKLPCLQTQKSHTRISVAAGLAALDEYAGKTAAEIAASMPVNIEILSPKPKKEKTKGKKQAAG